MPTTRLVKKPQPFELLLDQSTIAGRVKELGAQITRDYRGKQVVVIGVLKGCMVFLSDLIRQIQIPVEVEFVWAASYRKGIKQEEDIVIGGDFNLPIAGRHVLLVEGVVESGKTVTAILKRLDQLEPASVQVVTLLDKPGSRRVRVPIGYRGFTIGNEFVIGFGLDNTQQYRQLPFIGKLVDR